MGVPQGGILSPLLSNVILHELDLYIEKRRKDYIKSNETRKPFVANPKYAAQTQLARLWGTKREAESLKTDISCFLKTLSLSLSEEKTLITNTRRGQIKFLGTHIRRLTPTHGRLSKPSSAGNIRMTAPMKILTKRLREKNFCKFAPVGKKSSGMKPLGIPSFSPWPIKDIILRYRAILNGILNYYSFADNRGSLSYIYFILHGSLRNTICRKLDIGIREFYRIYGPDITIRLQTKQKG
ncbi:type II intron maturase-domain-containing protein [Tirmania nivea]|nr:type II intron maturase-domain-containing protein [Tirmania nivea]